MTTDKQNYDKLEALGQAVLDAIKGFETLALCDDVVTSQALAKANERALRNAMAAFIRPIY